MKNTYRIAVALITLIIFIFSIDTYADDNQPVVSTNGDRTVAPSMLSSLGKWTAPSRRLYREYGYAVDIEGDWMIVGEPARGNYEGSIYIYERSYLPYTKVWNLRYSYQVPRSCKEDWFGAAVAISGDYAVVGAPAYDEDTGRVYIFYRHQNGADEWGLNCVRYAPGIKEGTRYGCSVDISGDFVIVGASNYSESLVNQGAAFIYYRPASKLHPYPWWLMRSLYGSSADEGDYFGYSVSLSGSYAVVGAWGKNDNRGAIYIFNDDTGGTNNWGLQYSKFNLSGEAGERFGWSVNTDGKRVIVGAPDEDSCRGAAYIFSRGKFYPGVYRWYQQKRIGNEYAHRATYFGESVDIDGDYAAVGEPNGRQYMDTNEYGVAHVFVRNNDGTNNWGFGQRILAADRVDGEKYGFDIAISGDMLVVGCPLDNFGLGAIYTYSGVYTLAD